MIKIPKYDFICQKCGKIAEIYLGVTEFDEAVCNECGGTMHRQFPTSVTFQVRWGKPKVRAKVKRMGA